MPHIYSHAQLKPETLIPRQYSNPPNLLLEYYDDTYVDYLIDTSNYTTDTQVNRIEAGANTQTPGSIQICGTNRTCTTETSHGGNYFQGTRTTQTNTITRGGTLATGDTDFWITKHPDTTRTNGNITIAYYQDTTQLQSQQIQTQYTPIGFGENRITIEPRKGSIDRYIMIWQRPNRYSVNENGIIEQGSISSNTHPTYYQEFADNSNFDNLIPFFSNLNIMDTPTETGNNELITPSYFPTVSGRELWIRLAYQETRSGNNYDIISQSTRFITHGSLTTVTETSSHHIAIKWEKPAATLGVDQYQYRIGSETGSALQTAWTSEWITICNNQTDPITETTDSGTTYLNYNITATQPHSTNDCGSDPHTGNLQASTAYRVHLRAVDQQRTENPYIRNYVAADLITLTQTPTTPSTTPTTRPPTPTNPPVTQPPTTPSTQPTPTGGINNPNPTGGLGIQPSPSTGENPDQAPIPQFTDTTGHTHQTNIGQLASLGVTRGCNPPTNDRFCPDRAVTRAEMATFLVRAFELPTTDDDPFTDTQGNVHRTNINRMAAAGTSRGCNPPTNDRFCPDRAVTRGEMATFMTRVLELTEEGTGFTDTAGNVHATNIQRFATAGITRGCNPPTNTRYCPDRAVSRGEMATFLVRSTSLNTS